MCDQATQIDIQETVQYFVQQDKMFTAFEVTLAVKEKAKADNRPEPRHRHIKNDIHNELTQYVNDGSLDQVLHDVGAPQQAFVYVPPGKDVNDYVPLKRRDPAPSTPAAASTVPAMPSAPAVPAVPADGISSGGIAGISQASSDDDEGDESDTGGRAGDARGTVCVPKYLMTAAGFNSQETAYAYADADEEGTDGDKVKVLKISKTSPPQKPLTTYTVDYHGNVRVTAKTLNDAGIGGGTYDFERDGDTIIVSLHK